MNGVVSDRALSDDPANALLDLYETALPEVYGYLVRRCGSETVAEDLTSETFLAAARAVERSPGPTLTVAWLVTVARNKLVDHWRRLERDRRLLRAVEDDAAPEPPDAWDTHLDAVLAHRVLDGLGGHHRTALTLRYLDGLPVPEIAGCIGRTVGATEALLVRARTAFRREYERIAVEPHPTPPPPESSEREEQR